MGIRGNLHKWIGSFLTDQRPVRVEGALSDWTAVTSGIPQGSVLGPTLFLIFINDLPSVVSSTTALFADDSKVYNPVSTAEEVKAIQKDMDSLYEWSTKWQLPFNKGKCKAMHFGRNNPKAIYKIGDTTVGEVESEKDLGVTIDNNLTFSLHHDLSISKANSRLWLIKRSFRQLKPKSFSLLYKALIRPILEYCSVVTNPILKRDDDRLEKVQRRATKLVEGMSNTTHKDRLKQLKLQTLKYRRKRADVLQVYRIVNQIDKVDTDHFFQQATSSKTRGNGVKIFKRHCKTKTRANTFSQRVVDTWNSLPPEVATAPSLNRFKSALDKHWASDPDRLPSDNTPYTRQFLPNYRDMTERSTS